MKSMLLIQVFLQTQSRQRFIMLQNEQSQKCMPHLPKRTPTVKFLLDENVDFRLSTFLKNKGYSVLRVPAGLKNGAVITLVRKEKRILLTNDNDFAHPLGSASRAPPGIIVFRIHPPDLKKLTTSLKKLLDQLSVKEVEGISFILEENGFTVLK